MSAQAHYCVSCPALAHCLCLLPPLAIGTSEAHALAELERINRTREAKRRAAREENAA